MCSSSFDSWHDTICNSCLVCCSSFLICAHYYHEFYQIHLISPSFRRMREECQFEMEHNRITIREKEEE